MEQEFFCLRIPDQPPSIYTQIQEIICQCHCNEPTKVLHGQEPCETTVLDFMISLQKMFWQRM